MTFIQLTFGVIACKSVVLSNSNVIVILTFAARLYMHTIRLGENTPDWEVDYSREFHMTDDSKLFPPMETWKARGYTSDVFGRWVGPEGDVALPLYEGRDDISLRFFIPRLGEAGKAVRQFARKLPFDNKIYEPRFLVRVIFRQR